MDRHWRGGAGEVVSRMRGAEQELLRLRLRAAPGEGEGAAAAPDRQALPALRDNKHKASGKAQNISPYRRT